MAAPLESSIVRFHKSNGAVVGAGFLVSKKHVLTCAHVVADALGIARDTQDIPTEDVYLDFPLVDSETQLTARVVFWNPVPPKGSISVKGKEDIAGLELKSPLPEGVQPVGLVIKEDLRGHPFRTFGFPSGHDDGLEATGVLRGRQGTGWVQLEGVTQTGIRLEPGFSGAPVWDEKLNRVVGMTVAADQKRPEAKVAFMIPTKVLAIVWQDLDQLTISVIRPPNKRFQVWREQRLAWISLTMIPLVSAIALFMPQSQNLFISRKSPPSILCNDLALAQKPGTLVIAITNFSEDGGNSNRNLYTEELLLEALVNTVPNNVAVCRINKISQNSFEAKKLGEELKEELKVGIVIWGAWDKIHFRVGVKIINANVNSPSYILSGLPSNKALEPVFQTEDLPKLVTLLTNFTLSQLYYFQGQAKLAQNTLESALTEVKRQRLDEKSEYNAKELAKAYFYLGLLFSATATPGCEPKLDCERALAAYQEAFRLNKTLDLALLNQGIYYRWLRKPKEEMKVYKQLIESKSPQAAIALENRAFLFIEQGNRQAAEADFELLISLDRLSGHKARGEALLHVWNEADAAIKDLDIVRQIDSDNPQNYGLLGLAQLQAGQIVEARKTYQDVLCLLDENTRSQMIDDLKLLADKKQDLSEEINMIKTNLLAAAPGQCHKKEH